VIVRVVDFGNGDSGTTSIAFDAGGRQRATKDPMGTVSRTIYDISGRVQKVIQNCTESTTNPVPPSGNWWECDGSTLNDGTWNLTTTYGYDARSNKTSETAPNGRLTTFVYDDADRLISRIDNDVASPNGPTEDVTTSFHYDDAGRQVAVKAPLATTSANAVTRLLYNGEGRLWKEIRNCTDTGTTPPADPATCTGAGTADADTNVVTEYAYDDRGNKTVVTAPDPSASGTQTVTTRYAFDADNRLCRVLENATVDLQTLADPCSTAVSGTASQNVSTRYTYDGAGNLVSMIDGRGKTTTYGYDAAGRMTSLTDANGKTVTYGYDALGRRIRQSNRVDPPLSNSVTWTHDGAGRLLTRTAAGAATVTYTYDDNGNQLSASDGTRTITTTYDRPNRPLSVSVSNDAGAGTTYSYRPARTPRRSTSSTARSASPTRSTVSRRPRGRIAPTASRRRWRRPTTTPPPTATTISAARRQPPRPAPAACRGRRTRGPSTERARSRARRRRSAATRRTARPTTRSTRWPG
jgi:YD repeat-containing protein